ncbi:MAG: hypothetical protein IKO05_01935 [Selenomonadaceae bacterium]|nr:hypothetical protein [Selenomonadaceae bacterium]
MATVIKFIRFDEPLRPEQIERLRALKNRPIVYDEDCPELTDEELKEFKPVNPHLPRPKRPKTA